MYHFVLFTGEANCLECVQVQKGNIDMILAAPHGGIYSQLPYLNRTHGCLNGENCEYNHTCYSNPPDPTQCQDNNR